jgi:hypothetical protein
MPSDSRHSFARAWALFLRAGGLWLERHAFVHAVGSLPFYTFFSMAPVVIIAVRESANLELGTGGPTISLVRLPPASSLNLHESDEGRTPSMSNA